MRFGDLAGVFENVSLSGVEHREIGFAGGDMRQGQGRNLLGAGKCSAGFGKIIRGLGLHRSRPSFRSSCMKPVRSR